MISRIEQEKLTVRRMVSIYCKAHCRGERDASGLCADCRVLVSYAHARLDRCPYGERKSSCRLCPIHCYRPEMRERVRDVMRYAGPQMLRYYPIDALVHLWQEKIRPKPFPKEEKC